MFLQLKEINSGDVEFHEVYPPDVVILMYDLTDPNSFSFIADIFLVGISRFGAKYQVRLAVHLELFLLEPDCLQRSAHTLHACWHQM